eukprot:Nitzschia sp. Nitz4//scaffold35_size145790//102540//106801//NITZ4_003043-RA/size145790-augustus-gene-0.122-mRNA-1//1//CDS//3329549163//2874//frame0
MFAGEQDPFVDDEHEKDRGSSQRLIWGGVVGLLLVAGGVTGLVLGLSKSSPTPAPTPSPTSSPTIAPTRVPTVSPTSAPTIPTLAPTSSPTTGPSQIPSASPTSAPTGSPSKDPTPAPTVAPTLSPTRLPNSSPTASPTSVSTSIPTQATPISTNILTNSGFDGDTLTPWVANSEATVSIATDATSDDHSSYALVSDRDTDCCTWQGIGIDVTGLVEAGVPYEVSVYAKLVNVTDADATATFYVKMVETDTSDTASYPTIIDASTDGMLTTEWKHFTGSYSIESMDDISSLFLYAEGVENGWSFAVDNFEMSDTTPVVSSDYISSAQSAEYVTIPNPPEADLDIFKENCPYADDGLVSWESLFPSLSEGQNVTLPDDTKVLVTSSITTQLGYVIIPESSELIFDEVSGGITMDVEGMDVQGALLAGSETCRFDETLTITLHGERPEGVTDEANAMPTVYKGISVTGHISLHGKRFYRTWTRLAKRVLVGESTLYLQDEVNWEVGQQIVLITTALRDSRDWHQNEVFTITSIDTSDVPSSEVKAVVTLDGEAQYDHIACPEYQAEVGLLSRTILIQGAEDDSPPTDASDDTCQLKVTGTSTTYSAFGYNQIACADSYLTGFGGHVMVHSGGVGYIEGVEFYRMGQTNALARYPMHFHVLGDDCADCYVKDSAFHESYYRCISIHGTNNLTITENVAYDITGYCYYLEDGVEEYNTLSYNLAAHINIIGSPAIGTDQYIQTVQQTTDLTLPADITASGFYITNLHNYIIGNVASGGWSGFAFPILMNPVGLHTDVDMIPATRMTLELDGNTAHSTGHFFISSGAFYFGGFLYYLDDGRYEYNAGRDTSRVRNPCLEGQTDYSCTGFNRISNSKVYQVANVGVESWTGRLEVVNYESHDIGLSLEGLEWGFWIDKMYVTCRTGETMALPVQRADYVRGNGLVWYDTAQDHVMTDSVFKNCGYRSDQYNQYDTSETRGCGTSPYNGCSAISSTFGLLSHSDEFNPEVMQGTRNITFVEAGRRFKFSNYDFQTVSGRLQNWIDIDGSVSGLGEYTFIVSGWESTGNWWYVEDDIFRDEQGPLDFVKKNNGPARGLAHIRLEWDEDLHNTVGSTSCTNGATYINGERVQCPAVGRIRHLGTRFNIDNDPTGGLPVTAQPEIVGLSGGYGWLLELDGGAPHTLQISQMDIMPDTAVYLSVAYPTATSFTIAAKAAYWCSSSCEEDFTSVSTVEEVRYSIGNVYHFDTTTGLLTIRVTAFPDSYTGQPDWMFFTPDNSDLTSLVRSGVEVPQFQWWAYIEIAADCDQSGAYCSESPPTTTEYDDVCSDGYEQTSYDQCCIPGTETCEYAYDPAASI